jgi:hypothetical protein
MTDLGALLQALTSAEVEFIVVGGAAAIAHGSTRLTLDLDIVYRRTRENLDRLVAALGPHGPYLRGIPPGLPFVWDRTTLDRGMNFTLTTRLGDIDLLGEITGGGNFEDLAPHTMVLEAFGFQCRVLTVAQLIAVKRAVGRPKDLETIAELEAIAEEQGPG